MAEIKILCVGSLSEPFYRDMQAEFLKRLARYARLSVVEVPDEKCRRPSDAPAAVKKEGERLVKDVFASIMQEEKGNQKDTEELISSRRTRKPWELLLVLTEDTIWRDNHARTDCISG